VPGVHTPGANDIEYLMHAAGVPADLTGKTVLDIGATNAGAAFVAERRGASRVVALDIFPAHWFGVDSLVDFLGSDVEFVQGTVYKLPDLLSEPFDVIFFFGVLYHLRHPLLALDAIRTAAAGDVFLETAVADHELADPARAIVRFYRDDELGGDATNWFAPTVRTLHDWCTSSGYEIVSSRAWPEDSAQRASVRLRVASGRPHFEQVSYERSLFRPDGAMP